MKAQAELARALMVAGDDAALTWSSRVLSAPEHLGGRDLIEALTTRGSALIQAGRTVEAEVILRGAIVVADRHGDVNAAGRARNNLLGAVEETSLTEAARLNRESYEVGRRFGQLTWVHQAVGVGLRLGLDMGDWDSWADEMAVEYPAAHGFYLAWFDASAAQRMIYQGDPAESERRIREIGQREAVTSSAQFSATAAADIADVLIAQARWHEAFDAARAGWDHVELGRYARQSGMLAAVAAGEAAWLAQVAAPPPAAWLARASRRRSGMPTRRWVR